MVRLGVCINCNARCKLNWLVTIVLYTRNIQANFDLQVNMPWFNYTVVSNETLYLYCGAPGSCNKQGMVMIVNPYVGSNFFFLEGF